MSSASKTHLCIALMCMVSLSAFSSCNLCGEVGVRRTVSVRMCRRTQMKEPLSSDCTAAHHQVCVLDSMYVLAPYAVVQGWQSCADEKGGGD